MLLKAESRVRKGGEACRQALLTALDRLPFKVSASAHSPLNNPVYAESKRFTVMATIGINCLGLALPIFILQVYDRVLPNQTTVTLAVLIVGFALAFALDVALRVLRSRVGTWTAARLEHTLRCRLIDSLLATSVESFSGRTQAEHLDALNAIPTMRDAYAFQMAEVKTDVVFAFVYLATIGFLGGWLVLVPITLLLLYASVGRLIGRNLHDRVFIRADADRHRFDYLLTVFAGIQSIKALSIGGAILRRMERLQEKSAAAVRDLMFQSTAAQAATVFFVQANTVTLLALGALLVLRTDLTLGGLAACTLLSGRALQPIQTAMSAWTNFQSVSVARDQLEDKFGLSREQRSNRIPLPLIGSIELANVTFRSSPASTPLLNGVDLKAIRGEVIAIQGPATAATHALFQVLLGLVRPQAGSVTIDGNVFDTVDLGNLRRQVAWLRRSGPVYSGTILENLTNFRDGEIINEVFYLAYLLGMDEAIRHLPFGFDTTVRGFNTLPSQLKTQVAFVRELTGRPNLILVEDAEAELDPDGRQRLINLLRQLAQDATLVVVSADAEMLALGTRHYRLVDSHLEQVMPGRGAGWPQSHVEAAA